MGREAGSRGRGSYTAMPKTEPKLPKKPQPQERQRRADYRPDLVTVIVRLEKRQNEALAVEAERQAAAERKRQADKGKLVRADKSRIVRAALDAHLGLKK